MYLILLKCVDLYLLIELCIKIFKVYENYYRICNLIVKLFFVLFNFFYGMKYIYCIVVFFIYLFIN